MTAGSELAHASIITFDTYAAGTSITSQYSGVTVSGGWTATPSGLAAPAHSGVNVLTNVFGSPLTLSFATGQDQLSWYYTSTAGFFLTEYANGSSTALRQLSFSAATAETGITLSDTNLTRVVLTPYAGFVTLDDLTYTAPGQAATTPEPASLLLFSTGLLATSMFPAWRAAQQKKIRAAIEQAGV